jgi:hypothetical protein
VVHIVIDHKREGVSNLHPQKAYEICMRHRYRYVGIKTHDGKTYAGFISDVDPESVTLAIPTDEVQESLRGKSARNADLRQFFGFPRRRFFRRALPLATIAALSVLPFFGAYPYYYPYPYDYPYPYPYPYPGYPYYY